MVGLVKSSGVKGALLAAGDPAPVVVQNEGGRSRFLLVGDHAGNAVPAGLADLGLRPDDLLRHIALDIGVAGLGMLLAQRLGATFIRQPYSRLVVDCNRDPQSAEAIVEISDGVVVPGNLDIGTAARRRRVAAIHAPYQRRIAAELARRAAPILVSLHSFTPILGGHARPWDVGVLHGGGDAAFARAMLSALRRLPGLVVGDNEPYRFDATDHTVPRHAFIRRIPYVELEVRQDLIADAEGQQRWSDLLALALEAAESESPA